MISEAILSIHMYTTQKEEIITSDSMGNAYVIRLHYGTEIDLRNEEDVIKCKKPCIFTLFCNVPIDAEDVSYNLEVNLHKIFEKELES